MSLVRISDTLSIMPQPAPEDFGAFHAQGFRALINCRPDGEAPGQLGTVREARAAEDAGLSYTYIPATTDSVTEADVLAFRAAIEAADGPVLAHCQSGKRALLLFALGDVLDGHMTADDLAAFGARHGFDLTAAVAWLERRAAMRPRVKGFFDARTSSVQYVVSDPESGACAIIDAVLDYDEKSGATSTRNADAILAYIADNRLTVAWILDTHPHADHFSAAQYLKFRTGAPTAIGACVVEVQALWKEIYDWPALATDGSQWDRLFADGETFRIGAIEARVIASPGHTLASITYLIGDAAFIHDTLFMPDGGSARADFPGGDAGVLWGSIERILALPDETRLFTGHDYQPNGRTPRWESTVGQQKSMNTHVAGMNEEAFVALRTARDRTLAMPKLILHALQVNIDGGRLPAPAENGRRYLKIPLDALPAGRSE